MTGATLASLSGWANEIGLVAACLTTSAFLPQLIKVWRSKSAKDVSLVMFVVFTLGIALWFLYGLIRNDLVIILANAITFLLALAILLLKLRFDR
jgi:MtN3 and saliva related transmembrane protein